MEKNTSNIDRILRLVLGVILAAGAWVSMESLGSLWGWVLVVVGLVLIGTAAIGFCPLYRILGISTNKSK